MICNLGVVGSNPTRGSRINQNRKSLGVLTLTSKFDFCNEGQIPEWPNGADCKSAGLRLRWFESIFAHGEDRVKTLANCGSSSVDRALAFQAEGRGFEPRLPLSLFRCYSSVVEHFLGKEEVPGSNPGNSSVRCKC